MKIFLDALSRKPTVSVGTIAYIISDLQIINTMNPNCVFYMLSVNPVMDELYLKKLPYEVKLIKRSKNELGTIIQIRKILKEVDIVISSWGDSYITLPPYLLYLKALVLKKKSVPLVLFPSSIGPFNGGIKDFFAIRGLQKFDKITVRDEITYEYLKKYNFNHLELIHDAAFVLKPEKAEIINEVLTSIGLENDEFIGLNISVLLYHLYQEIGKNYIKEMVSFIQWLKKKYKLPILLIPHQIFPDIYEYSEQMYESRGGDDRYAIELILSELKNAEGIYHLSNHYTPQVLKGIIGKSTIFIGGRMHSIIGSVSQCTPSLILEYSHKASGMMKMLDLEDYVWPIWGEERSLHQKIDQLYKEKGAVREKLEKMMPVILKEIYDLANMIEELVSSK